MAVIQKPVRAKETFVVCDRCGKEHKAERKLTDMFEIQVHDKWHPIKGTIDGWMCAKCFEATLIDWYNKNKPSMVGDTPLFNKPPSLISEPHPCINYAFSPCLGCSGEANDGIVIHCPDYKLAPPKCINHSGECGNPECNGHDDGCPNYEAEKAQTEAHTKEGTDLLNSITPGEDSRCTHWHTTLGEVCMTCDGLNTHCEYFDPPPMTGPQIDAILKSADIPTRCMWLDHNGKCLHHTKLSKTCDINAHRITECEHYQEAVDDIPF